MCLKVKWNHFLVDLCHKNGRDSIDKQSKNNKWMILNPVDAGKDAGDAEVLMKFKLDFLHTICRAPCSLSNDYRFEIHGRLCSKLDVPISKGRLRELKEGVQCSTLQTAARVRSEPALANISNSTNRIIIHRDFKLSVREFATPACQRQHPSHRQNYTKIFNSAVPLYPVSGLPSNKLGPSASISTIYPSANYHLQPKCQGAKRPGALL
ncbi:hypothetical protein C8R44DRAFT_738125 [Mycena epipterygia]|nr:hypothetical protein C8R44DRAFT_738125 [Mycena epipterygia]